MDKTAGGRRTSDVPPAQSATPGPAAPSADGPGGSLHDAGPPVTGGNASPPHGPDPKWLRTSRAHVNTLTGRLRRSVIGYTGDDHKRINGWLRRRNPQPDPWVSARVKDLDMVLAENSLTRRTILTRTVDADGFGLTSGDGLPRITGIQRIERGYMSTTRLAGGSTKNYMAAIRLTVVVPPGTPAAAVEDVSKYPGQSEILLGRGLGFMIVDPTYDSQQGMWCATMLIQPGGGTR